jgi:Icc-related predicted phosphoesterase
MKIVMISDTHSAHRQVILPKGDVLIHAGDLCNSLEADSVGMLKHIRDCDKWFGEQDFEKVICIAGNHDFPFERGLINTLTNAVYLENEHYVHKGVKFFGSPNQLHFYGAFNNSEDGLKVIYERVDEDTDVLITHGPPRGILDSPAINQGAGSVALLNLVNRVRPKVHVYGHIHFSYGHYWEDETDFFNASQTAGGWDVMSNDPWVFELEV